MKNYTLNERLIIKNAVDSVSKSFGIKRYGIKDCCGDNDCEDIDLIRFELLSYQQSIISIVVPPTPPEEMLVYWGYSISDPINNLESITYQFQKQVEATTDMYLLDFTQLANNTFLIYKEPVSIPVKTEWYNTNFNYGVIPDQVFRAPVVIGEFRYYVSRNPVLLQNSNTKIRFT